MYDARTDTNNGCGVPWVGCSRLRTNKSTSASILVWTAKQGLDSAGQHFLAGFFLFFGNETCPECPRKLRTWTELVAVGVVGNGPCGSNRAPPCKNDLDLAKPRHPALFDRSAFAILIFGVLLRHLCIASLFSLHLGLLQLFVLTRRFDLDQVLTLMALGYSGVVGQSSQITAIFQRSFSARGIN